MTLVGEGVHRFGTRFVNWYVVEEGDRVTLVDAGLPGYWKQLDPALESIGRTRADVEAVVLTHSHSDHTGFAERLRETSGARVLIHDSDAELARSGRPTRPEATPLPYLRHRAGLRFVAHLASNGMAKPIKIRDLSTFRDGDVLDVPGRPRAVLAPGHTSGMCAFLLESSKVLVTGDELCNGNPFTGRAGVQIMPRCGNVSSEQALDSLSRIEGLDATTLVFGHGDPWKGTPAEAAAAAREAGPS
jgi:glyoxylase-like metal-dependent hydrolase (beta-lactamase superfamily II)